MPRWFLNVPVFRTRDDVDAYCERLGVVRAAGYRAVDGLRCCVELPGPDGSHRALLEITADSAIEECAEQAANIERQSAELASTAERMRT